MRSANNKTQPIDNLDQTAQFERSPDGDDILAMSHSESPSPVGKSPSNNAYINRWSTKILNMTRKEKAEMMDEKIEEFDNIIFRLDTDVLSVNE